MRRAIERVWAADALGARMLAPLGWAFGAATALRNAAYDAGLLRARSLCMPAVSVGNLSVGGTGKTPVSAMIAQWFVAQGLRPAILMRGYGDDEPLVHGRLTPSAIVIADPDRRRGAEVASARGARVAVLDDGFQHRQAGRDVDLVLVAAEHEGSTRLLPAGPYREGPGALRRADGIIVTRKSASAQAAGAVLDRHRTHAPDAAAVVVSLTLGSLVRVAGTGEVTELPLGDLKGSAVLAISAIGAPRAFEAQLAARGAIVRSAAHPDHHAFTATEAERLAARARAGELVVCTLKDAVKLESLWPRQGVPLWYLSQAVTVERGAEALDALLERLVTAARS